MKKVLKITLISLASLVGLFLVSIGIICLLVFTPARLTKIVNKEVPKFITCNFHIDKADLTLFKTFPYVGIDVHQLTLLNPMFCSPSDTLLHVENCTAAINLRELMKNNKIEVRTLQLDNGFANLFINKAGQNNFTIFKTDTSKTTEFNYAVDLQKISTKNVRVKFTDVQDGLVADLTGLDMLLKGTWENKNADGKVDISSDKFTFYTLDSNAVNVRYKDMAFKFKGGLQDLKKVNGDLDLTLNEFIFNIGENSYLDSADIHINSDLDLSLADQKIDIKDLLLKIDEYQLNVNGTAKRDTATGDIAMDLNYKTQKWPLKEALAMIPRSIIGDALDNLDLDGKLGLSGKIKGHYNENQLPIITADADWSEGTFAKKDFPLTFHNIQSLFNVNLDLNNQTDVNIKKLDCYTGNNHLTANGKISDLLERMLFDVNVTGNLHLPDFKSMLPDALTRCNGDAEATVSAKFDYEQFSNLAIDKMKATGKFHFKQLDLVYEDSLTLQSPSLFLDINFPVNEKPYEIGEWAEGKINAEQLNVFKLGLGEVAATGAQLDAFFNDLMDSTISLKFGTTYKFETIAGKMDTIDAVFFDALGTFALKDVNSLNISHSCESLIAHYGTWTSAQTGKLELTAQTNYDENGYNTLLQWNPSAKLKLKNGKIESSGLEFPLDLSTINVDFTMHKCNIQEGSGKFGNSDFTLSGKILNLDKYFLGQDLLTGNLELVSNYIDINEIMDIVSGMGAPDSLLAEEPEHQEDNPFMVPYGIDLSVHTLIKKALYEDVYIRNVGGYLTVKDGILVLDEMGFTSDAARMQLTAMYKSPRKNHLYLGLDFHLLDIKIAELINMIPEVDTVLPMLKAFSGNAEFHFAAETYLKSNYNLKYSTLRGAAAINGKDLVVLDNETYQKISKLLRFKKGTPNRIDSLSAEATVYKNEVDVYPFLVSIDKYQAILSGRHKLDMTYNYNISLIKPVRIGLDIIGTDKRKFKVGKAKYATLFRPEKQNVVEQNVMQLKTQIHEALKANVKPQGKIQP